MLQAVEAVFGKIHGHQIDRRGNGPGQLRQVNGAAAQPIQPEIHLRPNKLVAYKSVAAVMASAQRLGLTKIGLIGNEQFMQ